MGISKPRFWIEKLILATAFLTGFAGLVYEVTWQKYLCNILGSDSRAISIVLSVFMGGLSIGYYLFGRLSQKRSARLNIRICGWAEIAIGLWAFLFPQIYEVLLKLSGRVNPSGAGALIIDIALACALILIPTALMGCTFPLLTRGLSNTDIATTQTHAKLFGLNTLGAFVGSLSAGFYLIPNFGLPLVELSMGGVNIVCGVILVGMASQFGRTKSIAAKESPVSSATLGLTSSYLIAFLAGAVGITMQILFMRVIGFTLGASEYAFSSIVSVYILMMAVGVRKLHNVKTFDQFLIRNQWITFIGLAAFYFLVPFLSYVFMIIRVSITTVPHNFYLFHFICFVTMVAVLWLPVQAMGRTVPTVFGMQSAKLSNSGSSVGTLYFFNALGCVFGGIVGAHWLLNWLNLDQLLKSALLLTLGSIVFLQLKFAKKTRNRGIVGQAQILIGALALVVVLVPSWDLKWVTIGLFRIQKPSPELLQGRTRAFAASAGAFYPIRRRDDPNTSVSILEAPSTTRLHGPIERSLLVNGKSDGATEFGDAYITRLLAHLPLLLSTSTNPNMAIVGFGTGITPGTASLYQDLGSIDCIEISPAVKDFAPYFSFANHNVTSDPRFHWQVRDAYRFLSAQQKSYRVIISEPSNPWVGGVERLFSQEFYSRAKKSLDHNGVFAQWFHTYSMSQATLGMVFKTFSSVFEHTYIFSSADSGDIAIVGARESEVVSVMKSLEAKLKTPRVQTDLGELGIFSSAQLLGLELPLPAKAFSNFQLHTLEVPRLAYRASKDPFLDERVSRAELISNTGLRPWLGVYRERTLLSQWLNLNPQDKGFSRARSIAQNICQTKDLEGIVNFSIRAPQCSDAILGLVAQGTIQSRSPEINRRAQLIRNMTNGEKRSPGNLESKVAQIQEELAEVNGMNSNTPELNFSQIKSRSEVCFQGSDLPRLKCRAFLVETLISHGFTNEARLEFTSLIKDHSDKVPRSVAERLSGMLATSDLAQQTLQH